jgi:small-conductance mechanosensitive channel
MFESATQELLKTPWVRYSLEIVLLCLVAWILHTYVMAALKRWAKKTATTLDDEFVALLNRALKPAWILGLLAISMNLLPLADKLVRVMNRVTYLAILGVALFYGAKICQLALNYWLSRRTAEEEWREPVRFLTKVIFAGIGTMILLDNLGISLTAVWTTLGVGSVAIALALQDTLSNFFAGVYIRLDSPVRLGDYVKLDSSNEGFVDQIGWRSTRIRTLPNNIVVVPNSKLATAIITNYTMPEPAMSLLVSISVSYESDPEQVEKILVEEALRAAKTVDGLLSDPAPFVRFIPGFGASSLDFTLICRVSTYVDQYLAQHELRKQILKRFRAEGIQIPFPQQDVHLFAHTPLSVHSEKLR